MMTTDPRVIECAKAVRELMIAENALWSKTQAPITTACFLSPECTTEKIARACILKWLEQEPSRPMIDAVPWEEDIPTNYRAMCAQAAKEIME